MDVFPVAPELMQSFPVGALNLLVAVASAVAAQHGPESARRLCVELARNDELWTYIGRRLAGEPADASPAAVPMADAAVAHVLELEQRSAGAPSESGESDLTDATGPLTDRAPTLPGTMTMPDTDTATIDERGPRPKRRRSRANGLPKGDA
jgi:hypothetical protein